MDLLPCPFCGAKPPYVELIKVFVRDDGQPDSWAENKKNRWQVGCGPCAAHSAVCKSEGEAVAHWNVRHEPARYDPLHQSWQTATREQIHLSASADERAVTFSLDVPSLDVVRHRAVLEAVGFLRDLLGDGWLVGLGTPKLATAPQVAS